MGKPLEMYVLIFLQSMVQIRAWNVGFTTEIFFVFCILSLGALVAESPLEGAMNVTTAMQPIPARLGDPRRNIQKYYTHANVTAIRVSDAHLGDAAPKMIAYTEGAHPPSVIRVAETRRACFLRSGANPLGDVLSDFTLQPFPLRDLHPGTKFPFRTSPFQMFVTGVLFRISLFI